jgi:hypothetical protein
MLPPIGKTDRYRLSDRRKNRVELSSQFPTLRKRCPGIGDFRGREQQSRCQVLGFYWHLAPNTSFALRLRASAVKIMHSFLN